MTPLSVFVGAAYLLYKLLHTLDDMFVKLKDTKKEEKNELSNLHMVKELHWYNN